METDKKLINKEEKQIKDNIETTHDKPVFIPATDIYEKNETIYVVCDMPGVSEKNIDISLENNVLTITGKEDVEKNEGLRIIHEGYVTGIYERSFTISREIDREKIKAKIQDGVLRIELPKSEKAKPKKIQISVEK